MPERKQTEEESQKVETGGKVPNAPLDFHRPLPGEPNPGVPSNEGVHLGTSLSEIKTEE